MLISLIKQYPWVTFIGCMWALGVVMLVVFINGAAGGGDECGD